MRTYTPITLTRDCEAIVIPDGYPVTLPAGSEVILTQTLGGDYTVMTNRGFLARIPGQDADALGEEPAPPKGGVAEAWQAVDAPEGPFDETLVWEQLATCYDPEIPVNIVDLGLIYDCHATPLPEGGQRIEIKMTLTAPGCGMGEILKRDVERKVMTVPGVREVDVELVFEPFWNPTMMSDAARLELNML
jgi:probable FeS assembly SUF system protein SufT